MDVGFKVDVQSFSESSQDENIALEILENCFFFFFFVKWGSHNSTIYILVGFNRLISHYFINMIAKIFLNTCKTSELKFIL